MTAPHIQWPPASTCSSKGQSSVMAAPRSRGLTPSACWWNHDIRPSMSRGARPASAMALKPASAARVVVVACELRVNAVQPMPTIAAWSFASIAYSLTLRQGRDKSRPPARPGFLDRAGWFVARSRCGAAHEPAHLLQVVGAACRRHPLPRVAVEILHPGLGYREVRHPRVVHVRPHAGVDLRAIVDLAALPTGNPVHE